MVFWMKFLEELGTAPRTVLRGSLLAHDYLRTLDILKGSTGPKFKDAVWVWESVGTLAGLKESTLRAEVIASRRGATNGVVGCSWNKCMLHLQETDQVMHQCLGCRKAVYCDLLCQERSVILIVYALRVAFNSVAGIGKKLIEMYARINLQPSHPDPRRRWSKESEVVISLYSRELRYDSYCPFTIPYSKSLSPLPSTSDLKVPSFLSSA